LNQIEDSTAKWNALVSLVILKGHKENNLWHIKRPLKLLSSIEKKAKLKIALIENPPELFPNLRHISGCSLQFLVLCALIVDENTKWVESYINIYDEDPSTYSNEIELILRKFKNKCQSKLQEKHFLNGQPTQTID
jgi:hypothetical protein